MPHIPRRLAVTLAGLACLLVAACGGGGNSGNGGVGTGGHDSPENATKGFINALSGYNGSPQSITPILEWLSPSSRPKVQQGLQAFPAQSGSIRFFFQNVNVGNASVSSDGVHATVPVGGGLCFAVSSSGGTESSSCSGRQQLVDLTDLDMRRAVVLDLGETLSDETRSRAAWAGWLGVAHVTFLALVGSA